MAIVIVVVVILLIILLFMSLRVVQQFERGVIFRLGVVQVSIRQPGLRLIIPVIDRMVKVSLQTTTMPIQSQQIITKDNVSIDVAAVAYFHIQDPIKSLVAIQDIF